MNLKYCKNHQSVYTALSRSSSLLGTLLLFNLDKKLITEGVSRDFRKECQELEILCDITRMHYDNKPPDGISPTGSA